MRHTPNRAFLGSLQACFLRPGELPPADTPPQSVRWPDGFPIIESASRFTCERGSRPRSPYWLVILRATPFAAGPFWLFGVDILGNNFSTSGASWGGILAPRDHLGGLWEQQDGLEVVIRSILFDFGVILGPVHISFFSSRRLRFHSFFGLVPR